MKIRNVVVCFAFLSLVFGFSVNSTDAGNENPPVKSSDISSDCTCKGFKMYGKIQFVDAFPDVKVEIVDAFPDLKVKQVDAFPDDCGEWQIVDAFPDTKVQIVDAFGDIKVQYVDAFPGIN